MGHVQNLMVLKQKQVLKIKKLRNKVIALLLHLSFKGFA
jgi:hypothetical protein